MSKSLKVAVIVVLGVAITWADRLGLSLPAPPAWALAWLGWILSGLALFFGKEILSGLRSARNQ